MAVSSCDLPRFSLLVGGDCPPPRAYTPSLEARILDLLRGDVTCECWFQTRPRRLRASGPGQPASTTGCWILHSSTVAFGLTSDVRLVTFVDGEWFASDASEIRMRKWHHVAFTVSRKSMKCSASIDGVEVSMAPYTEKAPLNLPISPTRGFCLGWSPPTDEFGHVLLHELRLWDTPILLNLTRAWMSQDVTSEHPEANHLAAHWRLCSGLSIGIEMDLSGHDLHLALGSDAVWYRMIPVHFHKVQQSAARLVTTQATTGHRNQFLIEIDTSCARSQDVFTHDVIIVIVVNFLHFQSPNLTTKGKGAGTVYSIQEFVRKLPSQFYIAVYDASVAGENSSVPLVALTSLDSDGKSRVCKALSRVHIETTLPTNQVMQKVSKCIIHACDHPRTAFQTVLGFVVNEGDDGDDALDPEGSRAVVQDVQAPQRTVEVHSVNLSSSRPRISNRFHFEYSACRDDLEWMLALVLHRIQTIVLTTGELRLLPVGNFQVTLAPATASWIVPRHSTEALSSNEIIVSVGWCALGDRVLVTGTAELSGPDSRTTPHIAISFTYRTNNGRRQVAHNAIRFQADLTDHTHIESALRNRRLQVSDHDSQLLEQRRTLMTEKALFVHRLVAQEVAEAENAFKKINIMKEELWAKRKWIGSRSVRLFEEEEMEILEMEARLARKQFTERVDTLNARCASSGRETTSRGASRSNKSREQASHRGGGDSEHVWGDTTDAESEESDEQKIVKVSVKLSLLTKALKDHESKLEDLFVGVRLAETKGSLVLNDARRNWIVRYQDMIQTKQDALKWTLEKELLDQTMAFQDERVLQRQQVDAESQAVNAAVARYDKELGKRRKRVLLCMKEIVGGVVDEFETSESVEASKRDLAKLKLLKTRRLEQDMWPASVYVCFPVDVSQREVPQGGQQMGALVNTVFTMCHGLRHFCHDGSEVPVCKRLSHDESFLWWGLEQQSMTEDGGAVARVMEERCRVQLASWAVMMVTYNSLFSSALAMSDLKETLAAARDQNKPVYHVQFELPYENLEVFRRQRSGRTHPASSAPVEREYLLWKQNFALFQTALAATKSVETVNATSLRVSTDGCSQCSAAMPCLNCVWPMLRSSRTPINQADTDGIVSLVISIGSRLDSIVSPILQMAPRSFNLDPNALSPLSLAWEARHEAALATAQRRWEDAFQRRTKELQRQMGKLGKVYEEETLEVTALRFKLVQQSELAVQTLVEQLQVLNEERALLETWRDRLKWDGLQTEVGRERLETERMLAQELWQHQHHADHAANVLEEMDEREDPPAETELAHAKAELEVALRKSSRAILELGRVFVEDRYRHALWQFKIAQYEDQIKVATMKITEKQTQLDRAQHVFSTAFQTVDALQQHRERFLSEDAESFFHCSSLEIRLPPTNSTLDLDHDQLRKLAKDVDFHSAQNAVRVGQALQSQFAASTVMEYRSKLQLACDEFLIRHSPSPDSGSNEGATNVQLKDFCQYNADDPSATWLSLCAMRELIQKEALHDRESVRLADQWKLQFVSRLLDLHIDRWWIVCKTQVAHLHGLLQSVQDEKERSLEVRTTCERQLRVATADRETHTHRLALRLRRVNETQQRHRHQLEGLKSGRHCFETATQVMNEHLQNYKTDAIYKAWHRVSDYHIGLVGDLYDSRTDCAQELDALIQDIAASQQRMQECDAMVQAARLAWLQASITDHRVCLRADRLQARAHQCLEVTQTLEKQRGYRLFSELDLRGVWLTPKALSEWYEDSSGKQRDGDVPVGRTGVDELLVQLSIARLDVIKQEKWRDALHRSLHVYERLLEQQVEMQHIIAKEVAAYKAMGDRLTSRVGFVRNEYEASGRSQYLISKTQDDAAIRHSSIDRDAAVRTVRRCREDMKAMITLAQREYLEMEATTCQLSWRGQQHLTFTYRIQQVLEQLRHRLQPVQEYLDLLRSKDSELFQEGVAAAASKLTSEIPMHETSAMGLPVGTALAVVEYYTRFQWFRTCLNHTTALGERIKSLREVLSTLRSLRSSNEADNGEEAPRNASAVMDEEPAENDQLTVVAEELRQAESALLLNRFESRRAERTSEALKIRLDSGDIPTELDADVALILPEATLTVRLFNTEILFVQRSRLQLLLRQVTTAFDRRDVAGNLAEVIFGASLDRNDLRLVFENHAKDHVEELWGVVYVALFFSRLFRRAALKKAATARRDLGSSLATQRFEELRVTQELAHRVAWPQSGEYTAAVSEPTVAQQLLAATRICVHESGLEGVTTRVARGILQNQPLHRLLAAALPAEAAEVIPLADELEERRAVFEQVPPMPTRLEVLFVDRHTIKIGWTPLKRDRDLIYVAEISENVSDPSNHPRSKRYWQQYTTDDKTSHTFYSLEPGHTYWVRVRSGFSRSKLGQPCLPLLVQVEA